MGVLEGQNAIVTGGGSGIAAGGLSRVWDSSSAATQLALALASEDV